MKKQKIFSLLRLHFILHLSRLDCFAFFIQAVISLKTINLATLARAFPNDKIQSAQRRLNRFIKEVRIPPSPLAKFVVAILGIKKQDSIKLIMDRTNWKLGKTHINFLFLSVGLKGIAIPLFFKFLDGKKSGNSNQGDRIELIEKFINTFDPKRIEIILGDREFIGCKWLKYLIEKKLPFCVRLQERWQIIDQNGHGVEILKVFRRKKKEKTQCLGSRKIFTGERALECFVSGVWLGGDKWVIVAHSEGVGDACQLYRERWKIEVMFKSMKSSGFDMENTHVTDPRRLETLTAVLAIVMAICYKSGELVIEKDPPKKKKHGGWPRTIIGYGIELLQQSILRVGSKVLSFKRLMRTILPSLSSLQYSFVR